MDVTAWGDSLTFGFGAVTPYPTQLASSIGGLAVFNGGVSGDTSTQILTRMQAAPSKWSQPTVIWAGRNNVSSTATVLADIASMVALLGHPNYLVLSVLNLNHVSEYVGTAGFGVVNTLNVALRGIYGPHYVDVRSDVLAAYDPTAAQDVLDFSRQVIPTSLLYPGETVHLNTAGYAIVAAAVKANFRTLTASDKKPKERSSMQFSQLTQDQLNHLLPGQGDMQLAISGLASTGSEAEAVSAAGALSITTPITYLSVSGTVAYTLAAGTYAGQRKYIECVAAATTPLGTLTITSPETLTGFACSAAFTFDTVGQALELIWTGTKWRAMRVKRAGGVADNVVIGTTVLTNKNMWLRYNCSVTGTVNSTGTQALPNGSAVGEQIYITNTTVSGTPIGSIDGVYVAGLAAAFTHLGAIGVVASASAVGDSALLTWNGSAWDCVYQNGVTFS